MRGHLNRLATVLAISLVTLIGGCVTPPETVTDRAPDPARWRAHQTAIQSIHTWDAEGRVAADFSGDSASGSVSWSQSYDLIDFRFRGPFGIGGFHIHGDDERLRIQTSRGEDFLLEDPIEDMRAQLGWALPVRAMRYWIVGIPDPGGPARLAFSEDGHLVALEQAGWMVELDEYADVAGFQVPRRINMRGDGIELRFVIDRWAPDVGDPPEGMEL